jgi:uncharacterized membrane protein YdjX (TVP38/TMEM64 family)
MAVIAGSGRLTSCIDGDAIPQHDPRCKPKMSAPADREPNPTPRIERPARLGRNQATLMLIRRIGPLAIVAIIAVTAVGLGWHRALSLETVMRHRTAIDGFVATHWVVALSAYCLLYLSAVALSIPGATVLTICGGLLFGTLVGGSLAVVSATGGATIAFLIARSALGEFLTLRAGVLAAKLTREFCRDAFAYLLFLRIAPIFPFWLVNVVPALCGIGVATFVAATAIGILPATFAFAFFGSGLDTAIEAEEAAFRACLAAGEDGCNLHFDLTTAATPQLIMAFVALGIVVLVPIAIKRLRANVMDFN